MSSSRMSTHLKMARKIDRVKVKNAITTRHCRCGVEWQPLPLIGERCLAGKPAPSGTGLVTRLRTQQRAQDIFATIGAARGRTRRTRATLCARNPIEGRLVPAQFLDASRSRAACIVRPRASCVSDESNPSHPITNIGRKTSRAGAGSDSEMEAGVVGALPGIHPHLNDHSSPSRSRCDRLLRQRASPRR